MYHYFRITIPSCTMSLAPRFSGMLSLIIFKQRKDEPGNRKSKKACGLLKDHSNLISIWYAIKKGAAISSCNSFFLKLPRSDSNWRASRLPSGCSNPSAEGLRYNVCFFYFWFVALWQKLHFWSYKVQYKPLSREFPGGYRSYGLCYVFQGVYPGY